MAIDSARFTMELERINRSTNEAVFILRRKEDNHAIGKMSLYHRKLIDRSRGQGKEGTITNPPPEFFPTRIVIDRK